MSNTWSRAMATRNAIRASRPIPGETVPVEPPAPPQTAPGTTTHQCRPPRHDPYIWVGDLWTCPDCAQQWYALIRSYDWAEHVQVMRWRPVA